MKTSNIFKSMVCAFLIILNCPTQAQQLKLIGLLNIKTSGVVYDNEQAGDLLRLELEKLNKFEVLQREDAKIILRRAGLTFDSCYSKESLIKAGKLLNVEHMLSGYVSRFGEKIIIRLTDINVSTGYVEKSNVMEYMNLQSELQTMLKISLMKLMGDPVDENVVTALTNKSFDSKITNPGVSRLVLSGPRIGVVLLTGEEARRLKADESEGGFGMNRNFMTTFGYQKEIQYLNEGNFQALFEIIPLVSGLDQGRFVPSLTLMNGFRDNKRGWEFALGPSISITQTARGFYDVNGRWNLADSLGSRNIQVAPNTVPHYAIDKRGDAAFQYSFVFAFGKSIRSGSMNLPLNIYTAISKKDARFGITFGFNSKMKSTQEN